MASTEHKLRCCEGSAGMFSIVNVQDVWLNETLCSTEGFMMLDLELMPKNEQFSKKHY